MDFLFRDLISVGQISYLLAAKNLACELKLERNFATLLGVTTTVVCRAVECSLKVRTG